MFFQTCLNSRNGGLTDENKIQYKQLFNFHYQDGVKMLTVGGLIYKKDQSSIVEKCDFNRLPFVRSNGEPYLIEVPILTNREIKLLDKYLPDRDCDVDRELISEEDIRKYKEIYRYFPIFAETEF